MLRNPLFYMGRTANKPTLAGCEHYNPVLMTHAQHQPRAQANRTSALPWIVVCGLNTARRCWGFFDSTGWVEHWAQVLGIF